jgi:fluoride ion exporter CrcB/FEX/transcription elongation factor Elf1
MMKSPSKLSTRSTPMRSPSSTISSFSSFYSVSPNVKTDILPTHCYVCTSSASHHAPVLQLCDCRVAMCESCAVERVCCTDEFTLDCSICGNKVAPSANGIIRNVDKVKDSIDGYLERSFRHFKLPVPAKGSTSFYAFQPLIAKFNKIENLAPFVREYYVSSSTALEYGESGEEAVDVDAVLLVTCAEVSILLCYFQLCNEDYHWWWRSFLHSGACAGYTALYAVWYHLTELEFHGFVPMILYYGYMTIICFSFFIVTGTIGYYSCFWFNSKIYGSIKVD